MLLPNGIIMHITCLQRALGALGGLLCEDVNTLTVIKSSTKV